MLNSKIIVHRGLIPFAQRRSLRSLENTVYAMQQAADAGFSRVEFDVRQATDGLVCFHDSTLNKVYGVKRTVSECTVDELQSLQAQPTANYPQSARIPSFAEMLACLDTHGLEPVIEIKVDKDQDAAGVAEQVHNEITQFWPQNRPYLVASFSYPCLQAMKAVDANIQLAFGIDGYEPKTLEQAVQLGCREVDVNHQVLTPSVIKTLHQAGLSINAYTVNDMHRVLELLDSNDPALRIASIFTDDPETARKVLNLQEAESDSSPSAARPRL